MKKVTIYLDPEVDWALGRRASAQGTTKAAVIRCALAEVLISTTRAKPRARGVLDGPGDLSPEVDRYLAETEFGET